MIELQTHTTQRFVRGARTPDGPFVRQVQALQPAGHWVLADGTLECGPIAAPGPIARLLARWLFDRRWVHYGKEP